MASMNPLSRELVFKIVYYGPGLGGKTTTLEHIHATTKPEHRGKLVSLATPVDRTLYFDFLPVRLPPVRGMNIRLQLFTVPGQVYFNATRKLVLTGADGVVFVSDSQVARADANLESLENLRENLADQGRDIARVPLIFQHNKRDLPDLLPVEELDSILNPFGAPSLGTVATSGVGVYEALEKISARVLAAFEERLPESIEGLDLSRAFEAVEGGLVTALRNASQPAEPPNDVLVARIDAPGAQHPSIPPDSMGPEPRGPGARSAVSDTSPPPSLSPQSLRAPPSSMRAPASVRVPSSVSYSSSPRAPQPGPARPPSVAPESARAPLGVSFAELWPESEQETVRDVEEAITRGRYWRAIELCETLVSRLLTSAAGLLGGADGPRDPNVVPMLLGLDGRRYLNFRSIVREARGDGLITAREALTAYAFTIDARIARSSIH